MSESANVVNLAKPGLAKLVGEIREHVRLGDMCAAQSRMRADEAEEHYKAAGMRLISLQTFKPETLTWAVFVQRETGLSQQRADELKRIAKGHTTVEETRKRKKESVRKSRAKSLLRSSENSEATSRAKFLSHADQAAKWASYSGPITPDLIDAARAVVRAWQRLVHDLEVGNENGNEPGTVCAH